jgi:hypothetical protein
MTSRLYTYRSAIGTTIKAAMPELRACETLSSKFDLGEIRTRSFSCPAVFTVLFRTPLGRAASGDLQANAHVGIFCIADGREDVREAKAFVMAEAVAALAGVGQLWGVTRVGPVEALDFEQINAEAFDRKGLACVVVTFRQRVSEVASSLFDDEGHVPTDLYVNGELVDHAEPEGEGDA